MTRRKLLVLLVAVTSILFAIYVSLCRHEFPIPLQWQQIHRGQLRTEVLAHFPSLVDSSLLDMKQFDQASRRFESQVFGQVSQYLMVEYDDWRPQTARVVRIQVRTETTRFDGLRNHKYVPKNA